MTNILSCGTLQGLDVIPEPEAARSHKAPGTLFTILAHWVAFLLSPSQLEVGPSQLLT